MAKSKRTQQATKAYQLYKELGGELGLRQFQNNAISGLGGKALPNDLDLVLRALEKEDTYSSYLAQVKGYQRKGYTGLKAITQGTWNVYRKAKKKDIVKSQFGNANQIRFIQGVLLQDEAFLLRLDKYLRKEDIRLDIKVELENFLKREDFSKATQAEIDRWFELFALAGFTWQDFEMYSEVWYD